MWCVEDRIRCAKDTGLGRLPSRELAINAAWCTTAAIAVDLLAWLQLTGLNGDLAKPNRNNCATGSCTPPPASCTTNAAAGCASPPPTPGHTRNQATSTNSDQMCRAEEASVRRESSRLTGEPARRATHSRRTRFDGRGADPAVATNSPSVCGVRRQRLTYSGGSGSRSRLTC